MHFYISPNGNDHWSGRLPEANDAKTDGPFATLTRASQAIRELRSVNGLPDGGVSVNLRGGDYILTKSFELNRQDSGEESKPITYRAYMGERVRLLGGKRLEHWTAVTDENILARLDENIHGDVLRADLSELGITEFGSLASYAEPYQQIPPHAHLEMFYNGTPLILARYPNEGWAKIAASGKSSEHDDGHGDILGILDGGFFYHGDRPKTWKDTDNLWMHGYWAYDWANSYEEIDSLDPETQLIIAKPPYGRYGYRPGGGRFYFLNILEELNRPGEYYVDATHHTLYFIPPENPVDGEILLSALDEPMILMQQVSHVRLEGIQLACCRGHGIYMEDCEHNLVAGCTLKDIGAYAVIIKGGKNCGVQSCEISEIGDGGVILIGGNRKTLTPCGHFATNNHIWHFGSWGRCYVPAVQMVGVGMLAAHNHLHDAPHAAILYQGNENRIEYNDIHHVCTETGDSGAIYSGRDFTARGNLIRYNYIHEITGVGQWGAMGMYFDDGLSGQTFFGNILQNATRAIYIPGGREIVVENNIFIHCQPAVEVMAHGLMPDEVWQNMFNHYMKNLLLEMNHRQPPYSEKYPELLELDALFKNGEGIPPKVFLRRNICIGTWTLVHRYARQEHITEEANLVNVEPGFVDWQEGDFTLKADSPAWKIGFQPIPFNEIGLQADGFRTLPESAS